MDALVRPCRKRRRTPALPVFVRPTADGFDAMCVGSPYGRRLSVNTTMQYVRDQIGGAFDAGAVAALAAIGPEQLWGSQDPTAEMAAFA